MFAFEALDGLRPRRVEPIGTRAFVLRGFALPYVPSLLPCIEAAGAAAPFRQMLTCGGLQRTASPRRRSPCTMVTWWSGAEKSVADASFEELSRKN